MLDGLQDLLHGPRELSQNPVLLEIDIKGRAVAWEIHAAMKLNSTMTDALRLGM